MNQTEYKRIIIELLLNRLNHGFTEFIKDSYYPSLISWYVVLDEDWLMFI